MFAAGMESIMLKPLANRAGICKSGHLRIHMKADRKPRRKVSATPRTAAPILPHRRRSSPSQCELRGSTFAHCSALHVPAVEVSSENFMAYWGSTEDQEPNSVK